MSNRELNKGVLTLSITVLVYPEFPVPPLASHLHPGRLLPTADGIVLEGELILPDDGPAVFVPDVGHHVHVGRPHLKLTLPVDDGGERGADQERTLGVALQGDAGGWVSGSYEATVAWFKNQ